MEKPLLEIDNLQVAFHNDRGLVLAVQGLSFELQRGETLGIVGESGCGKSTTALALIGLLSRRAHVEGKILLEGKDLVSLSEPEWQQVRGKKIGMVFQDSMTALNPTMRVGNQIVEAIRKHQRVGWREARLRALQMFDRVGIPDGKRRFKQYPHEFSGGMRQRVVIALALSCEPDILIADEPTTALDVTIQGQILNLLRNIQKEMGTSIVIITHDLAVVAGMCDRVMVMYAGKAVEKGSVDEIFYSPQHPYTKGLLGCLPPLDPDLHPDLTPIPGAPPSLRRCTEGCPFAPRCPHAMEICIDQSPPQIPVGMGQMAACWLHDPRAQEQKEVFVNE